VIKSLKLRFILIVVFLVVSIVYCLPNVIELEGVWKKYLPSDKIHLGLDLKGGMHLLLELDTTKLMDNIIDRRMNALKDGMISDGVRFLGIDRKGSNITVSIRPDQKEKLFNVVGNKFPDLKAGTAKPEGDLLSVEFLLPEKELASIKENAVNQALETIRNRIDQFGVSEPVIVKQGRTRYWCSSRV
jgi:preprotein translocase subunit SecD